MKIAIRFFQLARSTQRCQFCAAWPPVAGDYSRLGGAAWAGGSGGFLPNFPPTGNCFAAPGDYRR